MSRPSTILPPSPLSSTDRPTRPRTRGSWPWLALCLLLVAVPGLGAQALIGYDLEARLQPDPGILAVTATLTLPEEREDWTFLLHPGLEPRVLAGAARLEPLGLRSGLEAFRLRRQGPGPVTLGYAGPIRGDLEQLTEGMGRARQWTRGIISAEGVVLDGGSGWYPRFEDALYRFRLQVDLPPGWSAVSQGAGPDQTTITRGTYPENTTPTIATDSPTPAGATTEPAGATAARVRMAWREDRPQDDIYLIAAPFTAYVQPTPQGEAQVYLRQADEALARRYLDATADYLALYSDLIGPYPYAKFALVENFWETGYGMPSFTLLGPQVIRLPFILHSSYPHEILHNWWGNSVYIDYATGNWSEGLTAYLADHLLKEREGQGAQYRRDGLQAYADYVRDGEDFPLSAFRGRHGSASQAIGYGKSLMLFHMLRRDLGDETFVVGLRRFYADNAFRAAGYEQLRIAFEQVSGRDLQGFFAAWTQRTGAPELALSRVILEPPANPAAPSGEDPSGMATIRAVVADRAPTGAEVTGSAPSGAEVANGTPISKEVAIPGLATGHPAPSARPIGSYRLMGRVEQTQPEVPFPMQVPLVVHLADGGLIQHRLSMDASTLDFALDLPAAPLRLALDPEFDLFRHLAPGENPPSLSALFGAERGLMVLAAAEPAELATGYRQLAQAWLGQAPGWELVLDRDLERLPEDRPVWLLGWSNRFLPALAARAPGLDPAQRRLTLVEQVVRGDKVSLTQVEPMNQGGDTRRPPGDQVVQRDDARQALGDQVIQGDDASLALVREQAGRPLGLIASSTAAALPGLARKLPHYGKYGYLAFIGPEPVNRLKGQWPAGESALQVWFTQERPRLAPVPSPALDP